MRRMITEKQVEKLEEFQNIKADEWSFTVLGRPENNVLGFIGANEHYSMVMGCLDESLWSEYITDGIVIDNENTLTFYSGGGNGYIQFLGNSFNGDDNGLNINNNSGESAGIQLTPEGDIIMAKDGNVIICDLPTSDPKVEGALWNDNGVLKISAGE